MIKIISFAFFLLIIVLFYPDKVYQIPNTNFFVQEKGIIKKVSEGTESVILDTNFNVSIGAKNIFSINKNTIVINMSDGVYMYKIDTQQLTNLFNFPFRCLAYSKKLDKYIIEKGNELYVYDSNVQDMKKVGLFGYNMFSSLTLSYIVFISDGEFLYVADKKDNHAAIVKYNIKNSTSQRLYSLEKNECIPVLKLDQSHIFCLDSRADNEQYFTSDLNGKTIQISTIEPYGTYLSYLKSINAILYTKIGLSFRGETYETRVHFLDTGKDYLWSEKYLQPALCEF